MILKFIPHPKLQDFIHRITLIRYELDTSHPKFVNPFPPMPENCLFFYIHDKVICHNYSTGQTEELPSSILVGPQLSRVDLTMGYNMLVIVVGFYPGVMHRLLRIPMEEMMGRPFNAKLLLGREIEEVTEQLHEAVDFNKMISIVEAYLFKKIRYLKDSLPIEKILGQIIQDKNILSVDQLASQACVSNRQLERQFKERTGMQPKVFLRLVRFSRAWVMREKNSNISWGKIAYACNYADQMHMIRDFKDFAGVSPGVLQNELVKSTLRLQGTTID